MFTCDELVTEVKRLGTEYPNAIYRGDCHYSVGKVENGPETEGCIFGQAIRNLDGNAFQKIEFSSNSILGVCDSLGINISQYNSFEKYVPNKLKECQSRQDSAKTWGEAIKVFE